MRGRRALGALLLVSALGGTAAIWVATRPGHVAMPPPDASPATVVRTWLRAVDADDSRTARALLLPGARYEVPAWINDVRAVHHIEVRRVQVSGDRAAVIEEYDPKFSWGQSTFTEANPGDDFHLTRTGGRWFLDDGPDDGV